MRILMINVLSSENRGDLALIESEIQQLQTMLGNAKISISAVFPETIEKSIQGVKVIPELIDLPIVYADKKAGNRKSWKIKVYIALYTCNMLFQLGFAFASGLLSKIGLKSLYRPKVINEFKDVDLIVFNGGEALKEGSAYLSEHSFSKQKVAWWIDLFHTFIILFFSKRVFNKPVIVFPNTIGPFRTKVGRILIKSSVKCTDVLMVRDDISASVLSKMGISNFIRTSDIALLLKNDDEKRIYTIPPHTIGVSPGLFDLSFNPALKQRYMSSHAEVLDYLIEQKGFNVIFLPSNLRHDFVGRNDFFISKKIIENMHQGKKVQIIETKSAKELQNILEQLDMLVATRMHPTILASTKNVPFVSVIYDHKQVGFLSELNLENCGVVVNDISPEKLLSKITFVLENKDDIKHTMSLRVPILQTNTMNNIRASLRKILLKSEKCFHN